MTRDELRDAKRGQAIRISATPDGYGGYWSLWEWYRCNCPVCDAEGHWSTTSGAPTIVDLPHLRARVVRVMPAGWTPARTDEEVDR